VATVKGIQFNKPYFEYSGACAGCGETPYITLVSRLFGESMIVANATGCSSIYGGSAPSNPYTIDAKGHGPS
jgi:pyruvate-ferredoxin/flavodoxin oxidoreductase